jgi:pantetheine-phosphate adenylyltransferase
MPSVSRRSRQIAVYAGSFDPLTAGHVWMVRAGAEIFDQLVVAVGTHPDKRCCFTLEERLRLLKRSLRGLRNVTIDHFENEFLVDYARRVGARCILRGIRNPTDLEYERVMRQVNADLAPEIATLFLMPPRELAEVSSSFVRGLIGLKGWPKVVRRFVPDPVYRAFLKRADPHASPPRTRRTERKG